jgi:hypothetical protein
MTVTANCIIVFLMFCPFLFCLCLCFCLPTLNHHRVFASGVLSCGRGRASHTFTVESQHAASRCPSGLNATLQTWLSCRFNVKVS